MQKIPKKFGKAFGNKLSSIAAITVPNGRTWQVGLEKSNGRILFVDGWQEFVDYHSIASGYFLVFRYEGFSKFHVCIFDKSCTEIHYPVINGVSNNLEPKKEAADDDVEILEHYADQQGGKKKKKLCKCGGTCMKCKVLPRESKKCKLDEQADEIELSRDVDIFNKNEMHASHGLRTIDKDGLMFICRSFFSSRIKPVISKESERAIHVARSCKRTHPSFLVLLRSYNLSYNYVVSF